MNPFSISGLLIGISSLFFGIFVYSKNRNKKANRLWLTFCVSVAIWGFGGFKIGLISKENEELARFWWRIAHIGVIFIPVFFLHFIYVWLKIKKKSIIWISYLASFFFSITNIYDLFTKSSAGLFINKVTWIFNSIYWDTHYQFDLYWIYMALWLFAVFYAHYILYKNYKKTYGIQRIQIKYFLLAFIVSYAGGSTCYFPCFGINLYPILNFTVPFYPFLMSYTIVRYRFMDIRVAIKRGTIFSALVIVIIAVYILPAFIIGWAVFGGAYTLKSQFVTGFIVAVITATGFMPLYEWLKKSTDKFLFKGTYNPQELLASISDTLSRTLDLDEIEGILTKSITESMRVSEIAIVILPSKSAIFKKEETEEEKKDILAFNKIIDYFKKYKNVLILEELKRRYSDNLAFDHSYLLIKEMEKVKTDLIAPLYIKEKLIGLFLLGNKKSGDAFSTDDIRTIETIASQSAIAIENARLYEEMKDFSEKLQQEVDRQTKDLREANEKLKQLDKAKSLFISLASHQLRTPLTAIKGYISMLLEKTWGALNKEQEKKLKNVFVSNERLINLVEDLLAISRIESGRFEFNYEKVSLEKIIKEVIQEFDNIAKNKKLYLKFENPDKKLPKVKADQLKIRQVIQNLIDNAIHYTEKGGVTVGLKKEGKKIIISVKDTGIGISKEEKNTLFEKFSRGLNATKMFTEGTGLGLYFCAKLIRAHKGDIWAESEGKDKGSTFFASLPVEE